MRPRAPRLKPRRPRRPAVGARTAPHSQPRRAPRGGVRLCESGRRNRRRAPRRRWAESTTYLLLSSFLLSTCMQAWLLFESSKGCGRGPFGHPAPIGLPCAALFWAWACIRIGVARVDGCRVEASRRQLRCHKPPKPREHHGRFPAPPRAGRGHRLPRQLGARAGRPLVCHGRVGDAGAPPLFGGLRRGRAPPLARRTSGQTAPEASAMVKHLTVKGRTPSAPPTYTTDTPITPAARPRRPQPQFSGGHGRGFEVGLLLDHCRRPGGINDAAMATWIVASTWAAIILMAVLVGANKLEWAGGGAADPAPRTPQAPAPGALRSGRRVSGWRKPRPATPKTTEPWTAVEPRGPKVRALSSQNQTHPSKGRAPIQRLPRPNPPGLGRQVGCSPRARWAPAPRPVCLWGRVSWAGRAISVKPRSIRGQTPARPRSNPGQTPAPGPLRLNCLNRVLCCWSTAGDDGAGPDGGEEGEELRSTPTVFRRAAPSALACTRFPSPW